MLSYIDKTKILKKTKKIYFIYNLRFPNLKKADLLKLFIPDFKKTGFESFQFPEKENFYRGTLQVQQFITPKVLRL